MSTNILQAEEFGVAFGDRTVFSALSFAVPDHGVTVLLGAVGVGKSTLLRSLAGLTQANPRYREWGRVTYAGAPLGELRPALVVQNARAMGTRAIEFLTDCCRDVDEPQSGSELKERVADLLRHHDCSDLSEQLQAPLIRLDSAQQRRVLILGALAACPGLLMLDDPLSDLSEPRARPVLALLRRVSRDIPLLMACSDPGRARELGQHTIVMPDPVERTDVAAVVVPATAVSAAPAAPAPTTVVVAEPEPAAEPAVPVVAAAPVRLLAAEPALTPSPVVTAAPPPPLTTAALLAVRAQPEYRGPRGFRWVVPGRLGTAPLPGAVVDIEHDLHTLKAVGVSTLITLTRRDLPQDKLAAHGLRNIHLPIYDRDAPTVSQLRMLAIRMTRLIQEGDVLAVHCRAGLGRTGTVVAGWLIHEGLTAEAALDRLRRIDPGYVQSSQQEAFLHQLESAFLMRV